jgi:acetylornithine deacetylase/succinyl-diaminopimelate desuccinylase-like protein
LLDSGSLDAFCHGEGTDQGLARLLHASTRLTIAPTMVTGGVKTNVIPEAVDLILDLRTLPGQTRDEIEQLLLEIAGPELAAHIQVSFEMDNPASASSADTPLFDSLTRVTKGLVPNARTVPFLLVGITDARFYRRAGATAYGYGLFSERISMRDFAAMFHGQDERIDVESLRLTTELCAGVARDFGD